MTIKLYENDSYIKQFKATVTSCEKAENGYRVTLDKTAFFPTEGGQYHDNGTIAGIKVDDVILENGDIIHILPSEVFGQCDCEIDFDERFDKMQQHTGEHILCGLAHSKYGYDNVGFHLSDEDVTFDLSGALTSEQIYELEYLANKAVTENRKITAYLLEKGQNVEYRSKLEETDGIRIVEIDGIDKCACCAPHVMHTGEIGFIKITDWYSYKGGVRIHLACGQRAVEFAQKEHQNLLEIAKALSSKVTNAAEFFKKYVSDTSELKKSLSDTKKELVLLKAKATEHSENIVLFEDIEPSLLRPFVNALENKYENVCAVFSQNASGGYNYVIASKKQDMREFAKEFNSALSGKGGGSSQMIQGSVNATKEQIESFF